MIKSQKCRILRAKAGTTMVEVLVGVVILVLIMGVFSQAMNLAGRMIGKSNDTLMNYRNLAGGYYMEDGTIVDITESEKKDMTITRIPENGECFSVQVRTKTYTMKDGSGNLVEVVGETTAENEE